jgi:peptidyl-prolyl cis-trans isomerase C
MPNQVHCAHILVKTEKEAQAVLDRLSKGEKFSNIARAVSRDPGSGKRGGDLGWFTRGKMVKEFEQAAFGLRKSQTSPIVKTQFGYHIISRPG